MASRLGFHGAGDMQIVLEVGAGQRRRHFQGRAINGYDPQRPEAVRDRQVGTPHVGLLADDVKEGGQRGGGNLGVDPPVSVRVPDRIGLGPPGFSSEEGIQHDVQIEQDGHQPYFSIRCSSIHRSTVSSSGGGRSVLSKPWTSAADNPRVFWAGGVAGASALSRDSRILRQRDPQVVGQVLTRFSTSVSSVASAVLMGSVPSPLHPKYGVLSIPTHPWLS